MTARQVWVRIQQSVLFLAEQRVAVVLIAVPFLQQESTSGETHLMALLWPSFSQQLFRSLVPGASILAEEQQPLLQLRLVAATSLVIFVSGAVAQLPAELHLSSLSQHDFFTVGLFSEFFEEQQSLPLFLAEEAAELHWPPLPLSQQEFLTTEDFFVGGHSALILEPPQQLFCAVDPVISPLQQGFLAGGVTVLEWEEPQPPSLTVELLRLSPQQPL
mmetsp:Transcript_8495/g.18355  ORF Transcript_8495/g.18355 Transcript_8495/m.18355 type:complete len:217 (+) Transcript_8495:3536-4186(+)